ncbi:MAG: transketolase [Deltaproteobacteria bacterium]|nr:transketolase [Deltaproteobacteria bacterium]
MPDPLIEQKCVDTIRALTIDAVEEARSGHPGGAMGAADAAFVLWHDFLRHDPSCPTWPGRDRFVLSAGHMSMLVYSLLHLSGYEVSLDDIKAFRQWQSLTPGHPEYGLTPGVEVTAGPLGAGFAHAVGIALASRMAGARFHDDAGSLVDSRVFVIVSDGDVMEGVAMEAASLAGHLRLGNLICVWDDNRITIEGSTDLAFTEDVVRRFEAQGFGAARVDGHDRAALRSAIQAAVDDPSRPHLIASRTRIAYGSPGKEGSADSHGAPLGVDEVAATKRAMGWPEDAAFLVPEEVAEVFAARARRGAEQRRAWEERVESWRKGAGEEADVWDAFWSREPRADLFEKVIAGMGPSSALPTRKHSFKAIQELARLVPGFVGGSADLAPSNSVGVKQGGDVFPSTAADLTRPDPAFAGRNIHFGIRENAMGGVVNGMALFGGFRPYAATYLVFSDYLKPTIRLASLMQIPAIYLFSHDSFRVGEDGPTHQPIEHLWSLRAVPGLVVFRPADAVETAAAWSYACSVKDRPVAIVVSRQVIEDVEKPPGFEARLALKGAYVVAEPDGAALTIVATGSEVSLAVQAARHLAADGVAARIVSMPSVELFTEQPAEYRLEVLPEVLPVVSLEAGTTTGWHRFTGRSGLAIGVDHFGASAPFKVLEERFGFTPEAVAGRVREWWKAASRAKKAR